MLPARGRAHTGHDEDRRGFLARAWGQALPDGSDEEDDMVRGVIDVALLPARTALRVGEWAVRQGVGVLRQAGGGGESTSGPATVEDAIARAGAQGPAPGGAGPQASRQPKDLDDVTIARKVETHIFRVRSRPKSSVDVNVVDGVVWLRGQVKTPAMIRRLEAEAREIPEVRDVQNLLHLPNTPAPDRTDTPPSMRHTRRKATPPERPRRIRRRVNADKTIAQGEPLPDELAAQHRGRPPAPLGSHEPNGASSPAGEGSGEGPPGAAGGSVPGSPLGGDV
jgi:hypothetical protein